jgi:tRNA 5-methylaminomethyl-2-thiouridine biosynthesis bifunctional protein
MPLIPARPAFDEDGTPCSTAYGDVYHARAGGLAQALHVFLRGNALPQRWQHRERFTIVETGFGPGLNFLATWAQWRRDPLRCARLHFVSVELHPFTREDLVRLQARWPELEALARDLRAHWPTLTPGFHRLHLDGGGVVLTLLFGDATTLLPQLQCQADAFYLDGFAPARNPQMWSDEVVAALGGIAAPGATLATWSVSGALRRRLADAGFICRKTPGFAGKREMLQATFESGATPAMPATAHHALILGAGLAGSSVAHRLAERGWRLDVIDAANGPGQGASGNLAGVLRPLPSLDDNRLARITRAGALYGLHHLQRLTAAGRRVAWEACGVLHLARDAVHEARQRQIVEAHRYPADYLRFVTREQASAIANWPVDAGGWWFPHGAWVRPPSLCAANLDGWNGAQIRCHYGRTVATLEHGTDGWSAIDHTGARIAAAPLVIIANGTGITTIAQTAALPVRSARGQVTHLPALPGSAPNVVVCRLGYVSPAIDGLRSAGATFSVDDDETALRDSDHRDNLARLDFILPGFSKDLASTAMDGRVGFRPASPDRLPIVGAVPAVSHVERGTPLAAVPRQPGLYVVSGFGARGLVWASLAGELLASRLNDEPWPLERELADALDPARLLSRAGRRQIAQDGCPGRRTP